MAALADRHPANASVAGRSPRARKPLPLRILGFLAASLLLSILMEWIGVALIWDQAGHASAMLAREMGYLNADFRETVFGNDPALLITSLAGKSYYYLFQWTHLEDLLSVIGQRLGLLEYVQATHAMAQLFFVRLGILVFSLPIFALFATVGVSSGLTLRDIRRWSAGREFGGVYHAAKRIAPRALLLAWFVYLTLPVSLHPNVIILPCAALFGLNVMIVAASFKKYL